MATTTTEYQTGFAPDIAPYGKDLLGKYQALTNQAYQEYTGDRAADLQGLQNTAINAAGSLGYNPYSTAAAYGLQGLAQQAGALSYGPSSFNYLSAIAPNLQNYQMQGPQDVQAQNISAAQLGYAPQNTAAQFSGPGAIGYDAVQAGSYNAPSMQGAQTGYNPNLQNFQMGPAERVNTQSFAQPGSAEAYMSPYMQNVVDIQKREAQRQSGIQGTQQQAQATQAGAFGGSRDAIMRAERERNLGQQMGDIQATGSQAAFQQAQQQFNAEQQARLQAQQANQQAGLTVGGQNLAARLGVQQLGTQTGMQTALANLSNQQQAAVQNQAAQLQTQGMNAQQAMQAALANQQAGISTGQFNATNAYNTALQNAQMLQQSGLSNQALQGQYGLQQGQFQQAANMQNAQQYMQAQLANQQSAYNVGQQNLAAYLGVQQLGSGQNLQAQLANQGAYQQMQQLGEQSRQYGAGFGLQGLQAGMQGYNNLGAQGQNLYGQQLGNIGIQQQLGSLQQQTVQAQQQADYEDFLNKQRYPYQQLSAMSDAIRGAPMTQQSSTLFMPNPSYISQIGGLATAGLGAYGLYNQAFGTPQRAAGGTVKSYAKGGLVKADRKPAGLSSIIISRIG